MIALLIKASLVLIVLLAFYKVFLEKESFFAANRVYLLGCLVFACTLPFIALPKLVDHQGFIATLFGSSTGKAIMSDRADSIPTENSIDLSEMGAFNLQEEASKNTTISLEKNNSSPDQSSTQDISGLNNDMASTEALGAQGQQIKRGGSYWLMLFYFFGVAILSLNLLTQIIQTVWKVYKNEHKIVDSDGVLVNMRGGIEPCSFFKYIFINPSSYDYDTYKQIIAHEKIHVKQLHSIDLLLSELAVILLWFNPFIWILRKEVEKNIEYQTDDLMVKGKKEAKENYQLSLVKIATYTKPMAITTNYNQSLIKQRILKMNAKKSSPYSYWKYTFVAPLLFGLLLFLNEPKVVNAQNASVLPATNTLEKVAKPIIIEGHVEDAQEEFVSLVHAPRVRGNLEFSDFKNIGQYLDQEGNFRLSADDITPAGGYSLAFPKRQGLSFNLFEGDSIHFELSLADLGRAFATGRGAGKINILHLPQFQSDYFEVDQERNIDEFVDYVDSVITYQLSLLEAIYAKTANLELITKESNGTEIRRIIEESPLSLEEYEFLSTLVKYKSYLLLGSFLSRKSREGQANPLKIDLNSNAFRHFNPQEYQQLDHINAWRLASSLEVIMHMEYLREQQVRGNLDEISYTSWQSLNRNPGCNQWVASFLQKNFGTEIHHKYYADFVGAAMTLGWNYKEWIAPLDLNIDNHYTTRLREYKHLLNDGLNIEKYGLSDTARTLDQTKLQNLLKTYEGSPLLIVFWSAQFAGASIIDHQPAINAFANDHEDVMDIIYISIDKKDHQNLWAARIIDESWEGEHYFLPMEGNESIVNEYGAQKISSFSYDGATYTFIDKDGTIHNAVEAPYNIRRNDAFYTLK